jgi:hypothetical protein
LSKGGLQMRAACLPDPGTKLSCRFRALPSGAMVTAQGEVVWAHLDGADSGEFGLSFVDLDPKTEWLIEEMLAEQARLEGPRADGEVAATVAQLELEGSSGAIAARVAKKDGRTVVFEQTLDVLSVGRGVLAHAGGAPSAKGRQGSIKGVELRMVGSVPMLAVTVSFDEGGSSVGFVPAEGVESVPAAEHDTAPDLHAPGRSTLIEFDPQPTSEPRAAATTAAAVAFEQAEAGSNASAQVEQCADELAAAQRVHELPTANPALEAPDPSMFESPLSTPERAPSAEADAGPVIIDSRATQASPPASSTPRPGQ